MSAEQDKYQVYANNLANADTVGYRAGRVAQRAFAQDLQAAWQALQPQGGGTTLVGVAVDMRQGPLKETGAPLDLALEGAGAFVVQTPAGVRYTRAGNFKLNSHGQLVTASGYPVLGQAGPLTIQGGEVRVTEHGEVYVDGTLAGRLRIEQFVPGTALQAEGGSLLRATATRPAVGTVVRQGYLEGANVQGMAQLVEMMANLRSYEANAEALRIQSEALGELVRAARSS